MLLSEKIFEALSDGYDDEENRAETIETLQGEIDRLAKDSILLAAINSLCERITELEE